VNRIYPLSIEGCLKVRRLLLSDIVVVLLFLFEIFFDLFKCIALSLNNGSRQTEPNSGFHFELDYIYKVVYLPSLLGDK